MYQWNLFFSALMSICLIGPMAKAKSSDSTDKIENKSHIKPTRSIVLLRSLSLLWRFFVICFRISNIVDQKFCEKRLETSIFITFKKKLTFLMAEVNFLHLSYNCFPFFNFVMAHSQYVNRY